MTPDQIGLAVAIDINHFGDLSGERDATRHDGGPSDRCAIHQPHGHIARVMGGSETGVGAATVYAQAGTTLFEQA